MVCVFLVFKLIVWYVYINVFDYGDRVCDDEVFCYNVWLVLELKRVY